MPREAGGDHALSNLTLLCDGHHRARHDGFLSITGAAPELAFVWTNQPTHAALDRRERAAAIDSDESAAALEQRRAVASKFERAALTAQVRDALVALGFTAREARAAIDAARPVELTFESLLLAAIACCPKPS